MGIYNCCMPLEKKTITPLVTDERCEKTDAKLEEMQSK